MAYDEEFASRIRAVLAREKGLDEKKMFGGLGFLLGGHMAVAASGQGGLLLRVDPADTPDLVKTDGVERMVMQGREMDGWLHVDGSVVVDEADLARWVAHGVAFVRTLPPK